MRRALLLVLIGRRGLLRPFLLLRRMFAGIMFVAGARMPFLVFIGRMLILTATAVVFLFILGRRGRMTFTARTATSAVTRVNQ